MKVSPVLALSTGLILGLSAQRALAQDLLYDWDLPRCGATATQMAELISDCMGKVMRPRGLEGGEKAEVDVQSAALLCRRVRSYEETRSLQSCIRSLMYERSGLGNRRQEISPADASIACRYATSQFQAEHVEDCMRRLLYTRSGLGQERTEMTVSAAAYACQGVATPLPAWPFQPLCRPPSGEEASRFLEQCIKSLLYTRDGLGSRREEVTPDAAALACEGALSWAP